MSTRHRRERTTWDPPLILGVVLAALFLFGSGMAIGLMIAPTPPPQVITVPMPIPVYQQPDHPPTPARALLNCLIDQECA